MRGAHFDNLARITFAQDRQWAQLLASIEGTAPLSAGRAIRTEWQEHHRRLTRLLVAAGRNVERSRQLIRDARQILVRP